MEDDFKIAFDKLSNNYKNIITRFILDLEKDHKIKTPKKTIKLKSIVKYYIKKNNITEDYLVRICVDKYPYFSENTYKSILKRDLVSCNIKDNPIIEILIRELNIPVRDGIPYIDYNISANYGTGKVLPLTQEGYDYISEFQRNNVYQNFELLSLKNQKAVLYLIKSLYVNDLHPELFEDQF